MSLLLENSVQLPSAKLPSTHLLPATHTKLHVSTCPPEIWLPQGRRQLRPQTLIVSQSPRSICLLWRCAKISPPSPRRHVHSPAVGWLPYLLILNTIKKIKNKNKTIPSNQGIESPWKTASQQSNKGTSPKTWEEMPHSDKVVQTCNPSIQEAETGGWMVSSVSAWATSWVWVQARLQSETLS